MFYRLLTMNNVVYNNVASRLDDYFNPIPLEVGTSGGSEAGFHAPDASLNQYRTGRW